MAKTRGGTSSRHQVSCAYGAHRVVPAFASTQDSRPGTSSAETSIRCWLLIVTGRDRQEALERSRRALAEFDVEGIATAITFDRVVVEDPDFAPADPNEAFKVHTRWIETDFNNTIPAYVDAEASDEVAEASARQDVVVEVGGKRVAVSLPADLAIGGGTAKDVNRQTREAKESWRRGPLVTQ